VISVSDGKNKWVYAPGAKEYTTSWEGAARTATSPLPTEAESHLANARNIVAGYSHIDHQLREARFIGEEKLTIGERQVDCFVIEAEYLTPAADQASAWKRKLWIDKSRNLVLREIKQTRRKAPWEKTIYTKMTYLFTFANLDNQVTEALFAFVPPEGAKEVAELRSSSGRPPATPRPAALRPAAPSPSRLVGKDAIAFALKDLDGNQVDLQALKGKVVLLNFWASWCGPCVAEMPHIEKLHKDFKDKGLVVLGLNYNEEIEIARGFVQKKGYTFTTLLDEGREVSMRYGVSGIPQVFIIDREGKVKWHAIGYTSGKEVELRSAVEKVLNGANPPAAVSTSDSASVSPAEKVFNDIDPPAVDAGGGEAPSAPASTMARLSNSVLNSKAIKKAYPQYPSEARKARAQGPVQVEITVSESGKVIEAKAISGHKLLHDAAEQAAMQWEFKPTEGSVAPVKMQGILVFNFTLQ
jgi:TonB family protein